MTDVNDVIQHNRGAWNRQVENNIRWTVPVTPAEVADARSGYPRIILTPKKIVPRDWFPELVGANVLGLASGGGQQGPLLAAAGANVTIFDLSEKQLEQDQKVAEREGLSITTVQGRADQLPFTDQSFDLIVNPCSMCFFPEIKPVWQECARILRPGGYLMAGFTNPVTYTFDFEKMSKGEFVMQYPLPYSDNTSLPAAVRERFLHPGEPREFSHTLTDIIGGLLDAGFVMDRFLEDEWEPAEPINRFFPPFLAIRARLLR